MSHTAPTSDAVAPRSSKRGGSGYVIVLIFILAAMAVYFGIGIPIFLGIFGVAFQG